MSEPESGLLSSDTTSSPADATSSPADITSSLSPSRHRPHPGGLLYAIIAASFIGNILLVAVVTIQTIRVPRDFKSRASGFSNSFSHVDTARVCFTCDQLGALIESKDTLYDVTRISSGHTFCCQRQNNDITKVFKKIVSDEYMRRLTGREPPQSGRGLRGHGLTINKGSTGAHLYLVPQADSSPSWTRSDIYNTSFCSNVVCDKGEIVVPVAGTYLVYSHITFNTPPASEDTFLHVIQRWNRNLPGLGEKPVLFSKTSLTWTAAPQQTSFLSAIVKLRREDHIRVSMSDNVYDVVEKRTLSNYFGVIKM